MFIEAVEGIINRIGQGVGRHASEMAGYPYTRTKYAVIEIGDRRIHDITVTPVIASYLELGARCKVLIFRFLNIHHMIGVKFAYQRPERVNLGHMILLTFPTIYWGLALSLPLYFLSPLLNPMVTPVLGIASIIAFFLPSALLWTAYVKAGSL